MSFDGEIVKFELISEGIVELLQSPEIADALEKEAERVAKRTGIKDGIAVKTAVGYKRARASIIATSEEGAEALKSGNTGLKALYSKGTKKRRRKKKIKL